MQQWDFDIVHRWGVNHHVPDALSRMFEEAGEEIAAFKSVQDPWYIKRKDLVQRLPQRFPGWLAENDKLYRHRDDPLLLLNNAEEERWKLVVPAEYREEILACAHAEKSAGHLARGSLETYGSSSCGTAMGGCCC